MKRILFFITLTLLVASACKTKPDEGYFEASNLPGMIYDADNRPCDKVSISAYTRDKEGNEVLLYAVDSDINGRFTLPSLDRGSYRITAAREGYEFITTDIYYSSRLDVLYLKIFSQKQILNLATEALTRKRMGNAGEFISRSAKVDPDDPYHLYLKAVYMYESDSYEEALIPLERIVQLGYRFPHVFLLMADIYQYKLDKPQEALEQLEKFKNLIDDGTVDSRIEELKE